MRDAPSLAIVPNMSRRGLRIPTCSRREWARSATLRVPEAAMSGGLPRASRYPRKRQEMR